MEAGRELLLCRKNSRKIGHNDPVDDPVKRPSCPAGKWIKKRQQNFLQGISDKEKYRIVFWYDNQENPGLADLRKIIH